MSHSLPGKSSIPTSESLDYGDESYASLVEQQRLCQGSAADVFLVPQHQIQVVKKAMRVVPTYFGGEGQGVLDKLRTSFSKTFGHWCLLEPDAYIIQIFFVNTKELTLYEEYCTNGDLRQYCKQIEGGFECGRILDGIAEGLAYLHSQNPPIVHGCINPGNIYVTDDFGIKLGEPSCSQLVVEFSHLTPSISVDWLVRWMSPEFFEGEPLTTQSDMWSLGCTFLEIITGRLPYYRFKSNTEVLGQILSDVYPDLGESFESPKGLRKDFVEFTHQLAKRCWLPALNRPTIQELQEVLSAYNFGSTQATPKTPRTLDVLSKIAGGGFRGKAIPGDLAGQAIFTRDPGMSSYDAGSTSKRFDDDLDVPRRREYVPNRSSSWKDQLDNWCDRVKLSHIQFTTTMPVTTPIIRTRSYILWQAVPNFPAITRRDSGVLYGECAPLNDDAVVGYGKSRREAIEDSAKKLLESQRYCV
ncbi:unnamed protein product [Rhizoctonia solani]|uniref:Protein kinase domain-containing protein n=1 Tax=Rhizoctonia solani TaxID=456999 RepID=A0A8H2WVP2_9AGAM|nr:unnamed protein product [Rhizoctonia solani]